MKQLLSFACLLLLLAGCLPPPPSQIKLENDFEVMKRHLARLEQGRNDGGNQARRQLEALGRQVAELQSGLDTLRVDSQSTNGRLDDLAHNTKQAAADMGLVRDDLSVQVSSLAKRLTVLEGTIPQRATVSVAATPVVKPKVEISPEAIYQQGLSKILKGSDYAGGRADLGAFIKKYPHNELSVNALYWIGESFYGEKKYESAILKFQEVIQKYSDHPKAAAALLKQGMAFAALGDKENARTTWKQLRKTFPLSPEAEKAKKLLQ